MNIFMELNHNIAKILHNFIINNHLEKIIWIMSDYPIFFLPIFLIFTWLYYTFKTKENNKKIDLLNIVYWIIIAIIINLTIQHIFFVARPEFFITPILKHIPDASFPSDHAAVSFAFLTWLFLAWYKKTWYIYSIFVIIMNFSRIAWWIHWFFDVIVWMFIWILSSCFALKLLKQTKSINKLNLFILKFLNYIKL